MSDSGNKWPSERSTTKQQLREHIVELEAENAVERSNVRRWQDAAHIALEKENADLKAKVLELAEAAVDKLIANFCCSDLEATIAAQAKEIDRLKAPVSRAELDEFFHKDDWGVECIYHRRCDELIASRAQPKEAEHE